MTAHDNWLTPKDPPREMPLDHPAVIAELDAAVMDSARVSEWVGQTGWRSYWLHDITAMFAPHGSDAQIEALAALYSEMATDYKACEPNQIAARERVLQRATDDEAEHLADEIEARAA